MSLRCLCSGSCDTSLKCKKPDKVCVDNEVRQRASKNLQNTLSGSLYYSLFLFDFLRCFGCRKKKKPCKQRTFEDSARQRGRQRDNNQPCNGVVNFRMEAPSGSVLPRSVLENRPKNLSLLLIARCRAVGFVPILAVCHTWQRYGDWRMVSSPQCCCS